MNLEYRSGLLFTSIEINYNGKSKIIDNIVIDTGAVHTLISQDAVDDIGIRFSGDDRVVVYYGVKGKEHAFGKMIDQIRVEKFAISNYELDFTVFEYEDINGLLGLDLLISAGFIIDLSHLEMYVPG